MSELDSYTIHPDHPVDPAEFLKLCQSWQATISVAPTILDRDVLGTIACEDLAPKGAPLSGVGYLQAHSESAYVSGKGKEASAFEDEPEELTLAFGGLTVQGRLATVVYFRRSLESTLALALIKPRLMNPHEVILDGNSKQDQEFLIEAETSNLHMPTTRRLRLPTLLPVDDIKEFKLVDKIL